LSLALFVRVLHFLVLPDNICIFSTYLFLSFAIIAIPKLLLSLKFKHFIENVDSITFSLLSISPLSHW
jgi:hypothetical protein